MRKGGLPVYVDNEVPNECAHVRILIRTFVVSLQYPTGERIIGPNQSESNEQADPDIRCPLMT